VRRDARPSADRHWSLTPDSPPTTSGSAAILALYPTATTLNSSITVDPMNAAGTY
jgi:hypothetical protein